MILPGSTTIRSVTSTTWNTVHSWIKARTYSNAFIVTDTNVAPCWAESLKHELETVLPVHTIVIPAGEQHKTLSIAQDVWAALLTGKADRRSLLVNLGGGMVCDLGGFAAATFYRGIDFVHIPTTLLAMVDAAIGGKTGVNFGGVKNAIGTFTQPRETFLITETLMTLPVRELRSGFGEMVKYGVSLDAHYLEELTGMGEASVNHSKLGELIMRAADMKRRIVAGDERENGMRKVLNFGHTLGHAVESLSLSTNIPLLHGEAVAIGMVAAVKISVLGGYVAETFLLRLEEILLSFHLPIRCLLVFGEEEVLTKIGYDKKKAGGVARWVLLQDWGKAILDVVPKEEHVREAIRYVLNIDH